CVRQDYGDYALDYW
nr:immunoglobulin heavy chain junction region [Mus musculus]